MGAEVNALLLLCLSVAFAIAVFYLLRTFSGVKINWGTTVAKSAMISAVIWPTAFVAWDAYSEPSTMGKVTALAAGHVLLAVIVFMGLVGRVRKVD